MATSNPINGHINVFAEQRVLVDLKNNVKPCVTMPTLLKYGTDLTAIAKTGKLDPVIGRKHEIERLAQILCKRDETNACLIGNPGVGKSVIVEGLAMQIADGSCPEKLNRTKVFSVDMSRLNAGATKQEEFEERLIKLLDEVKQSEGSVILFIDELHSFIGAEDIAKVLKPVLARGELKCIGATTSDEYKKYIEKDSALKRRFQPVKVPEPSPTEAIEILKGLKNRYEAYHGVEYTDMALKTAVDLSKKYIGDRYLPDKAIDLIDEAGARVQLHKRDSSVTEEDIRQLVSMWTGIPVEEVGEQIKPSAQVSKEYPWEMPTLLKYGTDLTALAKTGKLGPVIGRKHEIERVTQILCKSGNNRKNNVWLIGNPGVGKSSVVEGLAMQIADISCPEKLAQKKVFSVDMARLHADTSWSEFEKILIELVNEVKKSQGAVILFIDELHSLIDDDDVAYIFKPAMEKGELKCIGASTRDEYKEYMATDSPLKQSFLAVEVSEPSTTEAIEILKGIKSKYENDYGVEYTDMALKTAVELTKQHISERYLPEKVIDLIDEAGAQVHVSETRKSPTEKPHVTEENIRQVISVWTGIPVKKVTDDDSSRLLRMEKTFQSRLIGQDEAISAVSRAIRRAHVGLRDQDKPIANFLFTGPTGVGKTEMAKLLAVEYLGSKDAMVRLDMSEYMEEHTVSRLIGSPPGYVGHENGGQLTELVLRRPHTVVLFDEIEKANSKVVNVLLQTLDDGRLTDGKGRTVDFTNTIIIFTSNIGGEVKGEYSEVKRETSCQLKKFFKPEFLNRLDEIIVFKPLQTADVRNILDVMLIDFCQEMEKKSMPVKISNRVKDKLVSEGYDPNYGARPLRRAIKRLLEDQLAEKILSGSLSVGSKATIDVDSDGEIIIVSS